MYRVTVNVRTKSDSRGLDLEVPAEVPSCELVNLLAHALAMTNGSEQQTACELFADPPGRILRSDESLAAAGAWDGAHLVLEQLRRGRRQANESGTPPLAILSSVSGRQYQLHSPSNQLGRRTTAKGTSPDLIDLGSEPDGKTVSRLHARIEQTSEGWLITPLHSPENKTLINGNEVAPQQTQPLKDGDILQFGGLTLNFRSGAGR